MSRKRYIGSLIKWNLCILIIKNADNTIQLNSFQSLLRELQTTVTHQNDTVLQYLPHINALLERTVSVCKAAETTTNAPTQPLEKQENIHPGQTKELQWRFKKTAKSPGRKKSGLILRYRHRYNISQCKLEGGSSGA